MQENLELKIVSGGLNQPIHQLTTLQIFVKKRTSDTNPVIRRLISLQKLFLHFYRDQLENLGQPAKHVIIRCSPPDNSPVASLLNSE